MKILVTGGAGFIGTWLVSALLRAGHRVTVVDSLSPQIHGEVPRLSADWLTKDLGVDFVRADIRDGAAMDAACADTEAVVHLAAETGTGQSMYRIERYYDVNVLATAALFERIATRHRQVKRVVLASSRSVYGEGAYRLGDQLFVPPSRHPDRLRNGLFEPVGPQGETLQPMPTPEASPLQPASVYAATKLACETLGRLVAENYGLGVTALRFQNVYGEGQSLRNPYTGILSIFSNRLRQHLPLNIFEDGQESRDFINVRDCVRSIELALASELPGYRVFNVGSGQATSVLELARKLAATLDSRSELQVTGSFRAGDIRHCFADLTQVRSHLGFMPEVTLDRGLSDFAGWVLTQPVLEDRSSEALAELSDLGLGQSR
jgi:dTDP-L-rhamnose 4-epimerase